MTRLKLFLRIVACVLVLAICAGAFSGCGPGFYQNPEAGSGDNAPGDKAPGDKAPGDKAPGDKAPGGKAPGDYKMVLILPGPINDQNWNTTNYNGMTSANATLGTNIEYVENVQAEDFESTFRNYAERGYDLILSAGTQFDEPVNRVAENYPDTIFCVINGVISGFDNVAPVFPAEYEGSYLGGIVAGDVTGNGQFGVIGAFPNDHMERLLDTYMYAAVETAKANGFANAEAVRAYANSWEDLNLGKQMTEAMIDSGADTVLVYANQVGLGAIQACVERGVNFIGISSDQNDIAPETVLASIVYDFEKLYTWAVAQFLDGTLRGKVFQAGLAEDIFYISYGPSITQDTKDKVEEARKQIISGALDMSPMFSNPISY